MRGRIRLRTQHRVQPLRNQAAQNRVVQDLSGVNHRAERRRCSSEQGLDLITICDITGHDPRLGASGLQVRLELFGPRFGRALRRSQNQIPDPVHGDQMPGYEGTPRPRPTGHHHATGTHTPGRILFNDSDEPWHLDQPVPQPNLPLPISGGLLQQTREIRKLRGPRAEIHQQDPTGVLRLGRTHQSGDRSRDRVTTRTPNHHCQPSPSKNRPGRERLQHLQHPRQHHPHPHQLTRLRASGIDAPVEATGNEQVRVQDQPLRHVLDQGLQTRHIRDHSAARPLRRLGAGSRRGAAGQDGERGPFDREQRAMGGGSVEIGGGERS